MKMSHENAGRAFGLTSLNTDFNSDVFLSDALRSPRQNQRSVRRRLEMPRNVFEDEPVAVQNTNGEILKEIKELKALINDVKTKQSDMEKVLLKISKRLDLKDFDLAKSTHAANVTKICAKAYIQLGRFTKANASEAEQLRQEFANSPYGVTMDELLAQAEAYEKAKFTYWRAEERRRILGIGTRSSLSTASTRELADKISSFLGVKYNQVLEKAVMQQTALVKKYVGGAGLGKCQSDDKFWLNFYKWSERKYGARGPTDLEWHEIMDEHEE